MISSCEAFFRKSSERGMLERKDLITEARPKESED